MFQSEFEIMMLKILFYKNIKILIIKMISQYQQASASVCYFYTQKKDQLVLPLLKANYNVTIQNNFTFIELQQIYHNPFDKPLQIYYAIPTHPEFAISGLKVQYQDLEVIATIVQRQKAKYQYKKSLQKGETVMIAQYSRQQSSILKLKIGNIEPGQDIAIKLNLNGQLSSEIPGEWTLRIPSHIGPRYTSIKNLLNQTYENHFKNSENKSLFEGYANAKIEWGFNIKLKCSDQIASWNCETHSLKVTKNTPNYYQFELMDQKLPQIDLQFCFQRSNPKSPLCTYHQKCICLTFFPPQVESKQQKEEKKKFEFIFLLDRSGSMEGASIQAAKKALIIYLKSLPEQSKFNVISFGSNYQYMYKSSQVYAEEIVCKAIQKIEGFSADFGGTQIKQPLLNILNHQKQEEDYERHIILLTDGQVSDTDDVINTIRQIKKNNIGYTHTIGIGSGFSMDLIKKGAEAGEGNCTVIIKSNNMTGKIIYLLESIIKPKLVNFSIDYDQKIFKDLQTKIPNSIVKNRQNSFFFEFNQKFAPQSLKNTPCFINISYLDEESNQKITQKITLQPNSIFDELYKIKIKNQIENEIQSQSINAGTKKKIIEKSIQNQVLCKFTTFLCKIKQNVKNQKSSYFLKLKTTLEGLNEMYSQKVFGTVSIKTLTGRTVGFYVNFAILVQQLKQMLCEQEGIPPDQQRMVYLGKQLEDGRTLQQSGLQDESVIHLVLGLRGGDGGSSRGASINPIFRITIDMAGYSLILSQPEITPDSSILEIYQRVIKQYPATKNVEFKLLLNGEQLIKVKKIKDYPNINSIKIVADGIVNYMVNVDELIKKVKINGSWDYDLTIISNLGLQSLYSQKAMKYQDSEQKSMTDAIVSYLKKNYSNKKQDFTLIYKKANEFLRK